MNYFQEYQKSKGLSPDGVVGPKTAAAMMADFNIKTKANFAHWFAQIAHESGAFKAARENMNYNEAGLLNIFRKYYLPYPALVKQHSRNPEMIGNWVYRNRMGNGDFASGDGFKYRGGGALQLTGKDNYRAYFEYCGLPPDSDPSLLKDPFHYFNSSVWFFNHNNVWQYCSDVSKSSVLRCSKLINLGNANTVKTPNGFEDRLAWTNKISKQIGIA